MALIPPPKSMPNPPPEIGYKFAPHDHVSDRAGRPPETPKPLPPEVEQRIETTGKPWPDEAPVTAPAGRPFKPWSPR